MVLQTQVNTIDLRKRLMDFMIALDGAVLIPPDLADQLHQTNKLLTTVDARIAGTIENLRRLQ